MSTALEERSNAHSSVASAQRLRRTTAAVRVSLRWLGVRKTLTPEQKSRAAESFGAEGEYLSARKKLLDTRHAAYKEVVAVRGRILAHWKGVTLPFPEPGIRLLRHEDIESFHQRMLDLRSELHGAVASLDDRYDEMQSAAKHRFGRLYNPADYPASLQGLFEVEWDFPAVEPPNYLMQLSPAIYEQERSRVAARFEEAVQMAEQALVSEFARLVSHLAERLAGEDGAKKIFRDSAVTNLVEFFERFRRLNVSSNAELEDLVDQARQTVRGVNAQELRDNDGLRQHIAVKLGQVETTLQGLIVEAPRRRIVRSLPPGNGEDHAAND
jgi:hypothetical protein